jgi:hypothetical protein
VDCSGCTEPEDKISNTTLLKVLPCHWLPATFKRRMIARGNNLLAAFFCEALLKDFHIVSSFNYNLKLFHGSFLKHIALVLWHTIEQDNSIFRTSGLSQLIPQARVVAVDAKIDQ